MDEVRALQQKVREVRDAALPDYAWPGGERMIYVSEDAADLCGSCAASLEEILCIIGVYVYHEGPPIPCAGCGVMMESSYGDPTETTEEV